MQTLLFHSGGPGVDRAFKTLRRMDLGDGSWVDHQSSWLSGHEEVFETLVRGLPWKAERRWMYEREVEVPRLVSRVAETTHPILDEASDVLSERYRSRLDRLAACYYRSGDDSVAEHGDRMGEQRADCVIAIVSVGAPRPFTLRPTRGGRAMRFLLGWGDLLVMGGRTQMSHVHGVPKVAYADPRISVQFRPAGEEGG